jgi:hypothetical protein
MTQEVNVKFYFYIQDGSDANQLQENIRQQISTITALKDKETEITTENVFSKTTFLKKCCLSITGLDPFNSLRALEHLVRTISFMHGIGLNIVFEDDEGDLSKQYDCIYRPIESFSAMVVFHSPYFVHLEGTIDNPQEIPTSDSIARPQYFASLMESMQAFIREHNIGTDGAPHLLTHTGNQFCYSTEEYHGQLLDPHTPRNEYFLFKFDIADPSKVLELFTALSAHFPESGSDQTSNFNLVDTFYVLSKFSVQVELKEQRLVQPKDKASADKTESENQVLRFSIPMQSRRPLNFFSDKPEQQEPTLSFPLTQAFKRA